jgi:dienelactone hydrolase
MRSARFITSEGEEPDLMSTQTQLRRGLGVVLAGVPAGANSTIDRFTARGYAVLVASVRPDDGVEQGLAAVRSAMAELATDKVAVAGYGFGGRYAYLAVTRLGADAGAVFYGADIGRHLDEAALAKKALTFHFGDADERVPFEEVRAIKGALEGFATTEIYRYPGVRHGFALVGDPNYDEAAALAAERRVFAILDRLN